MDLNPTTRRITTLVTSMSETTDKRSALRADYGDATPEQVAKALGKHRPDELLKFSQIIGTDGAKYLASADD